MFNKCTCTSFGIIPRTNDLATSTSTELNNGASLSDDSGVPLTNSSISSADSFQAGMCRYDAEIVESDEETSHYDSLDNCSEGGMSTENFNTLKKGPVAPIDPPPEFQDSPQTTLLRSLSNRFVKNIRRWSFSQSFEHTQELTDLSRDENSEDPIVSTKPRNISIIKSNAVNKHLYSSEAILNIVNDNIYDEPNNVISTSVGTSMNIIDIYCRSPMILVSTKTNDNISSNSKYFKAIPSDKNNLISSTHMYNPCNLPIVHRNSIDCASKKHATYQYDSSLQRKLLHRPFKQNCQYRGRINSYGNRPHSRNSFNGRLSSSHNSLEVSSANKVDDSIFITQAMSHDALLTYDISDFYNVPIGSDIYAFPVDMIKPDHQCGYHEEDLEKTKEIKKTVQSNNVLVDNCQNNQNPISKNDRNKRRKRTNNEFTYSNASVRNKSTKSEKTYKTLKKKKNLEITSNEVKQFYQNFYSKTNGANVDNRSHNSGIETDLEDTIFKSNNCKTNTSKENIINSSLGIQPNGISKKKPDSKNMKNNSISFTYHNNYQISNILNHGLQEQQKGQMVKFSASKNKLTLQTDKKSQFTSNFKQKLCSIFRFRRNNNGHRGNSTAEYISNTVHASSEKYSAESKRYKFQFRALPPLPKKNDARNEFSYKENYTRPGLQSYHFTSSIEKVKDYGWYWGPLSSESAEKVLSNEPDGSFIVRDSSDDHYIFSLSFKLNSCVRHVRIEQDQGTFSFGTYAKFKSQTITEFIGKAVEHSRSGRYLFFLHRRPEHGPLRVQLTNPVSRFKHIQSLQHMCRFVVLKAVVRKDLIQTLPLPRRLLDYLSNKHCFSEQVESDNSHSQIFGDAC